MIFSIIENNSRLAKKIVAFFLLTIDSFATYGQVYQIPNALQQPQWVFTIYIEDSNGLVN